MKFERIVLFFGVLFLLGFFVSASFSNPTNNVQYRNPSLDGIYSGSEIDTYWPGFGDRGDEDCSAVNDFVIGIVPGGCSPMVVTSDLLEEQDVPVFCQLYSVQVNPLIEVYSIDSISFKGDYPDGVSGVSFYPAQAAIRSQTSLRGSPSAYNIGYVVIRLKQEKVEANMEDWVAGNLTATISYDAESAYGTGKSQYYLDDSGSDENLVENSFWNGMGYLRLKGVGGDEATVELMKDKTSVFRTVTLEKGKTSGVIYFPGYQCRAGLKLRLNDVVSAEDSALLSVDGDDIWVRKGSRFLNEKCRVVSLNAEKNGAGKVKISCSSKTFGLEIGDKGEDFVLLDASVSDDVSRSYKLADDTVKDLLGNYRSEKKAGSEETYGEEALFEQIKVAGEANLRRSQMELANLFIEKYPGSKLISSVEDIRDSLGKYSYSEASRGVYVSNDYHSVEVRKFRSVGKDDKRVDFSFGGKNYKDMTEGDNATIGEDKVLVKSVDPGVVTFYYYKDGKYKARASVKEDDYGSLDGKDIKVTFIEVSEVAYVSLIPEVNNKKSEANFTFKIGIEKRAIQLSPEKTEDMIKNLEATIADWKEINEKLGDVIRGLKGACFATSAFLTVKNMAGGMSGEALARKKVMEDYKKKCATDERYRDMSATQCYNELSSDIDSDVSAMASGLSSVNSEVDSVLDKYEDDGIIKDNDAYVSELRGKVSEGWEYEGLTRDDLTTSSQVAAVLLVEKLRASGKGGVALTTAEREMEEKLKGVAEDKETKNEVDKATVSFGNDFGQALKVQGSNTKGAKEYVWGRDKADSTLASNLGIKVGTPVQGWVLNGKNYVLVLEGSQTKLNVDKVYFKENVDKYGLLTREKDNLLVYDELKSFVFLASGDSGECSNVWLKGNAKISYYESGLSKGRPALVPFDLDDGWYAKVSADGYTEAGDVRRFMLCNIGTDSVIGGSDLCQSFDANTAGNVNSIGGCDMSSREVSKLYSTARSAINEALKKYGQTTVSINGFPLSVGSPSEASVSYECQDFMSPSECKMMFNVCDPVICPTSRCDMGGAMPVANVAQTGILGSILLCLPNAKEGIVVPVCLTGVHTGIESFVSILESERDCLNTSLETGENVGICDEITSIYLCEFFWNQFSQFFDKIVPSVLGALFGGNEGIRGGGEYLLVDEAWNGAQNSFSYFKDVYAKNAFAAFNVRSVEEAGGEVCRAFVGSSVPTSAELIDNLLEPESPTQFYAYFSSDTFTEASVPVTAHYKVYYHIYAGKDSGAQYKVYLKDPPETSYYKNHAIIEVASGYVAAGNKVDETKDFTSPEGYKQLCVSINGEDECGFTSVSTSIAVDYVSSKYVEDQASDVDIETEKECVSGRASVYSLASLNLQAGVEEMVDSDISLNGIVRVCATKNPGNSVGDASRWRDVGRCGDENLVCWLDVSSVKEALETVAAVEGTSIKELESDMGIIGEEGNMSYEDVGRLLVDLEKRIEDLSGSQLRAYDSKRLKSEVVSKLDNERALEYSESSEILDIFDSLNRIIGVGEDVLGEAYLGEGSNAEKARAYMLKARVYQKVVREFLKDVIERVVDGGKGEDSVSDDEGGSSCSVECRNKGYSSSREEMTSGECSSRSGEYIEETSCCCLEKKSGVEVSSDVKRCEDCGNGALNLCDEAECVSIGKNCEYRPWSLFKCVEVVDSELCEEGGVQNFSISGGRTIYVKYEDNWAYSFEGKDGKYEVITKGNDGVIGDVRLGDLAGMKVKKGCGMLGSVDEENGKKSLLDIVGVAIERGILNKNCLEYVDEVEEVTAEYDEFDGLLLFSLMQQESSCNASASSVGSSYGLMQISSFSECSEIGVSDSGCVLGEDNALKNIECGALILHKKYSSGSKRYNCSSFVSGRQNEVAVSEVYSGIRYALRGYNGWSCAGYRDSGSGSEIFADQNFVEDVMGRYDELVGLG